ncbi:peptide deformylase [Candidatus Daviesbacteria bacterium]|nr:peptide deformylase [Candidatus Daviesbacteria bacterium]
MQTKFLKPNNPLLKKIAEEISPNQINSPDTRNAVKPMLKVAYGEQKDSSKPIMVGLAAPQLGIPKRIILVDTKADGEGKVGDLKIYINPKIVWQSKRKGEWYEGCYSTGRVCGIVSRPISIKIQALNLHSRSVNSNSLLEWKAKLVEEKWSGYIARIFQHEIDHLDGKLFYDHIKNPDHLHWVEDNEFPLYRNRKAWRNWPKKYPLPLA